MGDHVCNTQIEITRNRSAIEYDRDILLPFYLQLVVQIRNTIIASEKERSCLFYKMRRFCDRFIICSCCVPIIMTEFTFGDIRGCNREQTGYYHINSVYTFLGVR